MDTNNQAQGLGASTGLAESVATDYSWPMAGPLLGDQLLMFIQGGSQYVKLLLKGPTDAPYSNPRLHSRLNLPRMCFGFVCFVCFQKSLAPILEFEPRSD